MKLSQMTHGPFEFQPTLSSWKHSISYFQRKVLCVWNRYWIFMHVFCPKVWQPWQHNQRVHRVCRAFPQGLCRGCTAGKQETSIDCSVGLLTWRVLITDELWLFVSDRYCWRCCISIRKSSTWLLESCSRHWITSTRESHMPSPGRT